MYCYDIVKAEVGYCAFQDQQSRDVNGIGRKHIGHTDHSKPDELEEGLIAGLIPGGVDWGNGTVHGYFNPPSPCGEGQQKATNQ